MKNNKKFTSLVRRFKKAKRILLTKGFKDLLGRAFQNIGESLIYNDRNKKTKIIKQYKESPKYLNVGGGEFVRKNWRILNVCKKSWGYLYDPVFIDFDVNLEDDIQWPIEDNSYDLIYSSHTFEHISDWAVKHALSESYRILKPGGGIRINVPDMDIFLKHYEQGDLKWFKKVRMEHNPFPVSQKFQLEARLLDVFVAFLSREVEMNFAQVRKDYNKMPRNSFLKKYTELVKTKDQKKNPHLHRNWFDFSKLSNLLKKAGFKEINRTLCGQSEFSEMCAKQFDKNPAFSIYVDAQK